MLHPYCCIWWAGKGVCRITFWSSRQPLKEKYGVNPHSSWGHLVKASRGLGEVERPAVLLCIIEADYQYLRESSLGRGRNRSIA